MQGFSKTMIIGYLNNKINTEKDVRKNCNKWKKFRKMIEFTMIFVKIQSTKINRKIDSKYYILKTLYKASKI